MTSPSGNIRGTGDFNFKSFLVDVPPVTRTLLLLTFASTILSSFRLIPISLFVLSWPAIYGNFEIWRLLLIPLSFFHMGGLGFGFLISMYFLYTYSRQLEAGTFFGRTANYAWFLVNVMIFVSLASFFVPSVFNGSSLLTAILHLWGRHAGDVSVSLYGFIRFPAKYLSLVSLGLDLITTGKVNPGDVMGLLGGHLYYFCDSVYPSMPGGKQLIFVPEWFEVFIVRSADFLANITGLGAGSPSSDVAQSSGATSSTSRVSGIWNGNRASSGSRIGLTSPSLRRGHAWGTGQSLGS